MEAFLRPNKNLIVLVYYQDTDTQKSYWLTYDAILDEWTKGYLGDNPEEASKYVTSSAGEQIQYRLYVRNRGTLHKFTRVFDKGQQGYINWQ